MERLDPLQDDTSQTETKLQLLHHMINAVECCCKFKRPRRVTCRVSAAVSMSAICYDECISALDGCWVSEGMKPLTVYWMLLSETRRCCAGKHRSPCNLSLMQRAWNDERGAVELNINELDTTGSCRHWTLTAVFWTRSDREVMSVEYLQRVALNAAAASFTIVLLWLFNLAFSAQFFPDL